MAVKAGTAYVGIEGDFSGLNKQVSSHFARITKNADKAGHKIGKSFGVGMAAGVGAAVVAGKQFFDFGKDAVNTASDINESLSKNRVLFGKYAKGIEGFSNRSADAFGISKQAALEYTGTFGNLFTALGVSNKQSAKFSTNLTKLSADMASFNNTSIEDALEAIRSGLVGETEPLRKFGVNINQTALEAEALSSGLVKTHADQGKMKTSTLALDIAQRNLGKAVKEHGVNSIETKKAQLGLEKAQQGVIRASKGGKIQLTAEQKALAAQNLIIKQTAKAHGDFQRTSEQLANQQRRLTARWADAKNTLGTALLPAVKNVTTELIHLADDVQPKVERAVKGISKIFARKDLSLGDKITGSLDQIKLTFGPLANKMVQGLKDAHLDDKFESAIVWAMPKILEAVKTVGVKSAQVWWEAFTAAPIWARVGSGAFLANKLGLTGPALKGLMSMLTGKGSGVFSKATPMPVIVMNPGSMVGIPDVSTGSGEKGKAPKIGKSGKIAGSAGSGALAGAFGGPWGIAIGAAIGTAIAFSPEISHGIGKALDAFTTSDAEKKGREIAKNIAAGAAADPNVKAALQKQITDAEKQITDIRANLRTTKIDPNTGVAQLVARAPTAAEQKQLTALYNEIGNKTAEAYTSGFSTSKFWDESSLFIKFRDEVGKLPPEAQQAAVDSVVNFAHKLEENGHLPRNATAQLVRDIKGQVDLLPTYLSSAAKKGIDSVTAQMQRRDATNAFKGTVKGILDVFPTEVRRFDPAKSVGDNFRAIQTDLRTIIKNGTPAARQAAREQLQGLNQEYKTWGRKSVDSYDVELQNLGVKGSKHFKTLRTTIVTDAAAVATGVKGSGKKLRDDLNSALRQAGVGGNKKAAATRTNIVNRFLETAQGVGNAGGTASDAIGTSVGHAANATAKGLGNVEGNLNRARKTLGLGPISFGLQPLGKDKGDKKPAKPAPNPWSALPTVPFGAQTGSYVPGTGTGDKVAAMLEPGEYVLNKKFVQKVGKARLDALNFGQVPRFQSGGGVNWSGHPALSGPIARAVGMVLDHFPGLGVTATTDHDRLTTSGNVSNHTLGIAADIAGSPDVMNSAAAWIGRTMGPSLLEGIHNPNLSWKSGRQVEPGFWGRAWGEHISHIHLALRELAAIAAQVGRQVVTGPKGALSDIIQSSVDLTTGLANSFIDQNSGGGDLGPTAFGAMSKSQLRALWITAKGDPKVANVAAAIAMAESGGIPSRNNADRPGDGGRHIAAGLWQILGLPFEGNVYDPLTNARMAVSKYKSAGGFSPWEAYTKGSYRQYLQHGGSVLSDLFQVGGSAGKAVAAKAKDKGAKANNKILAHLHHAKSHKASDHLSKKVVKSLGNAGATKLQGVMDRLHRESDKYADWAQRANEITDTDALQAALNAEMTRLGGRSSMSDAELLKLFPAAQQDAFIQSWLRNPVNGAMFHGGIQSDWLSAELNQLLSWRNALIDNPPIFKGLLDTAQTAYNKLKRELKRIAADIDRYERLRDAAKDKRENQHGLWKDAKKDLDHDQDALAKERKKKPTKARNKRIKELEAKIAKDHANVADHHKKELDADKDFDHNVTVLRALHGQQTAARRQTQVLGGDNGEPGDKGDGSDGRISKLSTSITDMSASLIDVQGLGSTMRKYVSPSQFQLGTLGGTILNVQNEILGLTRNPLRASAELAAAESPTEDATTDDPTKEILADLLKQANLRTAVSEAQFDVFRNLPGNNFGEYPFGGSFKDGGTVPGPVGAPRMIMAHGGEVVIPNDASNAPNVSLHFANGMEWLKQFVDVRVDNQTRAQGRRSERQLPGRAGTLR